MTWFLELPGGIRILAIAGLAILGHLVVQGIKRGSERIVAPERRHGVSAREAVAQRYPKFATVTSLVVSALTFIIYFGALGLILREFDVNLKTYLATASVVGLAVAFGLQGLVQDVVIGLTLVFTDVFDVGDMIELSGQVGRVEKIGLRFTTLVNFHGQRVFVPNRNIALVSRFHRGVIRAYVDVQLPEGVEDERIRETVRQIAEGFRSQHAAAITSEPEIFGIFDTTPAGWRYLRLRFRLWPGQAPLIETAFRQRLLSALKTVHPDYADWMVTVTYRVT